MDFKSVWQRSTLLRISSVLGVIALLAITVVIAAAVFTERSLGKGAAINVAGSLRMQSYLLATRVAAADVDPAERARLIQAEIDTFETRLTNVRLTGALPPNATNTTNTTKSAKAGADEPGGFAATYRKIAAQWREEIRPLAQRAASEDAARTLLLTRIHDFVALIDRFVLELESDLESRIHGLQVALGIALFFTLVLVTAVVLLLDVEVFEPVRELVRGARAVRRGEFETRVEKAGPDELGQLGANFNHMVEDLGRLYGNLEAQIAAKTADLAEKNRSLELLYETARALARPNFGRRALQQIAERARAVLGVDGVVICARRPRTRGGFPLARGEKCAGRTCEMVRCEDCEDNTRVVWHDVRREYGEVRVVSIPLADGERSLGVMPLTLAAGQQLDAARLELAQVIARHVGAALAAEESRDDHRRLALLEERSAIARELHDSIAQTLTYSKIQLTRLSSVLHARQDAASRPEAAEIVEELRTGIATAYRQLRELLTSFRLQLHGHGLRDALEQAVDELRQRAAIAVDLQDDLVGPELSANEQIHLLQIVREALANIEQLARARHAWVRVTRPREDSDAVEACIEDDGAGIGAAPSSPRHHFGLSIMRDRVRALGGSLDIGPRAPRGTRVRLHFVPLAAKAAGPKPELAEEAAAS
jgi:two-component system nitrate/nitrite sensor histidine kinase NarX